MDVNWEQLIKVLEGNASPREVQAVRTWAGSSAERQLLWQQLEDHYRQLRSTPVAGQQETEWVRLQERIGASKEQPSANPGARIRRIGRLTAAACILLLVAASWLLLKDHHTPASGVLLATSGNEKKKMVLPDSTVVWLNYHSSLQYDSRNYNVHDRTLELEGEAFFDVSKSPGKPFRIRTHSLTVDVLGTSFSIAARPAIPQQVSVATGRVRITGDHLDEQLTANEQLLLDPLTKTFTRQGVSTEEAAGIRNDQLVFDKDDLQSIAVKLQRWYDKKIVIANSPINPQRSNSPHKPISVTGIIHDDGLQEVLQGLSYIGHFTFIIQNNQIIIHPLS